MQTHKLSSREAASYLGVSESYLNKTRVLGGGPAYFKLGRKVVYDRENLDAWLASHRRQSTSQPPALAAA